jgi:hypothetical protein
MTPGVLAFIVIASIVLLALVILVIVLFFTKAKKHEPRGPQGFTGAFGSGPQGSQGAAGPNGSRGTQGPAGTSGTGPIGPAGPQGPQGTPPPNASGSYIAPFSTVLANDGANFSSGSTASYTGITQIVGQTCTIAFANVDCLMQNENNSNFFLRFILPFPITSQASIIAFTGTVYTNGAPGANTFPMLLTAVDSTFAGLAPNQVRCRFACNSGTVTTGPIPTALVCFFSVTYLINQ